MATDTQTNGFAEFLSGYQSRDKVFDELYAAPGEPREHWQRFLERFGEQTPENMADRWDYANRILWENGVTLSPFEDETTNLRPWEIDLLPLVYEEKHWEPVSRGVAQRAMLIEAIANDLYGPQKLLQKGILPPEILYRHPDFQRAFQGLPRKNTPMLLFGCELARSPSGSWFVMADRTSAPAGISYAVENRIVISKTLPQVLHQSNVHRLAPFFVQMQESIKRMAPGGKSNPTVVVLSSGPDHPYYFEDVFLARYLGYTLVEVDDLTVRKNHVCIKTLERLVPVDVILWRSPERNCDPLELIGKSPDGVAGLLQAIRHKNVVVTNGFEYGLLDSPVFMPFLPKMCEELLGEKLVLPSIATWWCGQPDVLKYVLEHLDELVIKPAFVESGSDEFIASSQTGAEWDSLRERILAHPELYVAQEKIERSSAPCWVRKDLQTGHIAMRTFAVKNLEGFETMNGGLVRVAGDTKPIPLSISAGEFSKDVWVCSDKPVPPVSLLSKISAPAKLRRANNQLPSRAADNLFWLGRYLERFDFAGRQIRKITERLMSESSDQPVDDVLPVIASLAELGLIPETYRKVSACPPRKELEEAWPSIVTNEEKPVRFARQIDEIQRLANTVRDRLSEDLWRAIRSMEDIQKPQNSTFPQLSLSKLFEDLNQLLLHLSAITGQVTDGLIHGPTRRFLLIGKHLERAQQMGRTIQHFLKHHREDDLLPLITLLDIANSLLTYRTRYRANIHMLPAIDLLVTDLGNPRSIIYQYREMARLIKELPRQKRTPQLSPARELVRRSMFELQSILPDTSEPVTWNNYHTALEGFLAESKNRTKAISEELTQSYFLHAGEARQIEQSLEEERL
ncbi:MAG: circularly permuted type 2 ATP-grasp protein [Planctomycetaceae bacterium]|nr:circularly permuted type 2 ATP-grasp protein [Planctomycetaceae bacterium]